MNVVTIYAAEPDLTDEADEDDGEDSGLFAFVSHECIECSNDVPGSPEDCPVICSRCSRDDYRI